MYRCKYCGKEFLRIPVVFPIELSGNLLFTNLQPTIQNVKISCENLKIEEAVCTCAHCKKKDKLSRLFESLSKCSRCGHYISTGTYCIYYNTVICDNCLEDYYKTYCSQCLDKSECKEKNNARNNFGV